MSKVEGGVRLTPPPLKALCNYFFFEASRVKEQSDLFSTNGLVFYYLNTHAQFRCQGSGSSGQLFRSC